MTIIQLSSESFGISGKERCFAFRQDTELVTHIKFFDSWSSYIYPVNQIKFELEVFYE